ncbi:MULTISPECIES: hypothetical protein [unclassified Polaromonas]|uniref:hypothetical protein n=1 Tax=unclassified Polaromonas TaxID=2638319 RepID=UPI0018C8FD0A|nr:MULTISPECIES: hypothetical protein [unclassified Polaromonas]
MIDYCGLAEACLACYWSRINRIESAGSTIHGKSDRQHIVLAATVAAGACLLNCRCQYGTLHKKHIDRQSGFEHQKQKSPLFLNSRLSIFGVVGRHGLEPWTKGL